MSTSLIGIFQGDIIIRTAIIEAFRDMKANEWVLDYVFSSLTQDALTAKEYGQREIDKAKRWFIETNIPVVMASTRIDDIQMPCVTIAQLESNETENQLADLDAVVTQSSNSDWPVLAGPFAAAPYDSATGAITLPNDLPNYINAAVVTQSKVHPILKVIGNKVYIATGITDNFNNMKIRPYNSKTGSTDSFAIKVEAANFSESYLIGCHSNGEAYQTVYLHSLLTFAILRYRQSLLEARGFQRSIINSTNLQQEPMFDTDIVYSRYVKLNGIVRNYWPKEKGQLVSHMDFGGNYATGAGVGVVATDAGTDNGPPVERYTTADYDRDALQMPPLLGS